MMRPKVFVTQPIGPTALARLKAIADVEMVEDASRIISKERMIEGVRRCDILFALLHDVVDKEVMDANPKLMAITSMSITPDRIDVEEATRRKLPVTVVPPMAVETTADICWALMMAVARRVVEGDRLVRQGIFPGAQSNYLAGSFVWSKTLGLVGGRGRIARAVARRARGFDMRILYQSRQRMDPEEEKALGATYVSLDELLKESDFVSLHPNMTPETHHMIGERELSLMKPTAYLINTSRGPVVDEKALARALKEKRIAGAGLDVFEREPYVEPDLLQLDNVVLTPHLGSAVLEARDKMANVVVDNIEALIAGRPLPNCVNPQVFG
ncbi:MAG: D-glycerate dehydrogenase [Variibacter sp.]|nr:D-glycerate dehydrogenase [Variibacter sp.]